MPALLVGGSCLSLLLLLAGGALVWLPVGRWRLWRRLGFALLLLAAGLVLALLSWWTIEDGAREAEKLAIAAELGVDLRTYPYPGSFPASYLLRSIRPGSTTREEVHVLLRNARSRYLCSTRDVQEGEVAGAAQERIPGARLHFGRSYARAEKYLFLTDRPMATQVLLYAGQEINIIYGRNDVVIDADLMDSFTLIPLSTCVLERKG